LIIKILKSFLSALVQNAFISVIIAIITVPVLISLVTGTLGILGQYLAYDTPIWLAALCALICICYIRFVGGKAPKLVQPKPERFLIEDSGFKWRVIDHKNGYSSVDQIPLCSTHESELVLTPGEQYMCRETISSECEGKILELSELTFYCNLAKSKANSIINKYETKY
jgi:hypothetical protein